MVAGSAGDDANEAWARLANDYEQGRVREDSPLPAQASVDEHVPRHLDLQAPAPAWEVTASASR